MTTFPPFELPLGFQEWQPLVQAAVLGFATFVQEDLPTVSAALLSAGGKLAWQTGLLGVFFGIWVGDALLYWVARGLGRPLLRSAWTRRFIDHQAVARSEEWFARKGTGLLLFSRFIPGTRLPTYLAAGLLHLPFGRFLLITGLAVGAWTIGIFLLAHSLGPGLLDWVHRSDSVVMRWVLVVVGSVVVLRGLIRLTQPQVRRQIRARVERWRHWEFWPAWLFYLPVTINYLRLAIRYRGLTLPTAANPGMDSGGFVGESKLATLQELQATSSEFTADAYPLIGTTPAERLSSLNQLCEEHGLGFPLILKPDIGQRGAGVKLIRTPEQAIQCLEQTSAPFMVQRYAPGPLEAGVFYYRLPGEKNGHLFAITEKVFPTITGDGHHTVEELIRRDGRAGLIAHVYLERLDRRRSEVLRAGETLRLVEAGNHAQGCIFRDGAHLSSVDLEKRIDEISQRISGFFIGRYDIRFAKEEDLRAGRGFTIIELNGAAAEATAIYDDRNTLSSAYRTLFRQWELVFAIGAANRRRGAVPLKAATLWRKWRETAALVATYPVTD